MLKARKRNSSADKTLSSTGKKRKTVKDTDIDESINEDLINEVQQSVFGKLVTKAGISITFGPTQNKIKLDQTIFQKNLTSSLKRHQTYPQVLDEFVEGLIFYIDEPERFCLSLLPTLTSNDCEGSTRGPTQDSLMRMLLGIDILQPSVAILLLEKIPEFSEDGRRYSSESVIQ